MGKTSTIEPARSSSCGSFWCNRAGRCRVNSLVRGIRWTVTSVLLMMLQLSASGVIADTEAGDTGWREAGIPRDVEPLPVDDALAEQRKVFRKALKAVRARHLKTLERLQGQLGDYPLVHYLEYERLRGDWRRRVPGRAAVASLNDFEQRSGDRDLTARLTRVLQERLIAARRYRLFLALKESTLASEMPCSTLRARYETGQVSSWEPYAIELWVQSGAVPALCRHVLTRLEKRGAPPLSAIWDRIYTAIYDDQTGSAKAALAYLSTADRRWVTGWIKARRNPARLLQSGALAADTMPNRRMIADLVEVWSRSNPRAALEHWQRVSPDYVFFDDRHYDTWRALAMRAAYRRLPQANDWLHAFTARDDDLELQEWRVRTALLEQDWPKVLQNIAQLPVTEQEEDHWAYWVARALEKTGRAEAAEPIYRSLATLQSYHGFLAADRLGQAYALREEPIEVDAELLAMLTRDPQLIRAREYAHVGLTHSSRGEWRSNVDDRPEQEIAASAVLAAQWGMHDRAVYSAGRADRRRAISLRFPLLHRTAVARESVANRIDPAWVFGVMRRESAYISDVRSHAGAIGLMQLMPRTASYVAGLKGQANWRGDLTDVRTNIAFGSFYLRHVLDEFDEHQALATASYNAGPSRVQQWKMPTAMEADVWVDTIPFTETRRYVRAVLAYASIYQWRLSGKATRLSTMMPLVPADAGT